MSKLYGMSGAPYREKVIALFKRLNEIEEIDVFTQRSSAILPCSQDDNSIGLFYECERW